MLSLCLHGYILLRGNNAAGKSITTQSFVPFILDGDRRPERLDPFGSRDCKPSNLLPDGRFRRGIAQGYSQAEGPAGFIGTAARKTNRQRQIHELEGQLEQLSRKLQAIQAELAECEEPRALLVRERKQMPTAEELGQALTLLEQSRRELQQVEEERAQKESVEQKAEKALAGLTEAKSPTGRAYIVENEMVFTQLCDRAVQFSSPLICTSSQPSVAALRLLDLLAASGTALFYSGDFDGKGLSIAAQLCTRYPDLLKPWHMVAEDYDRCRSDISLSSASQFLLQGCAGTVLEKTAQLVERHSLAGYQKLLILQLEADLIETP